MHLAWYTSSDYKRAFGPSFVLGLVVVLGAGATATGWWWFYWLAATLLLLELCRLETQRHQVRIECSGTGIWFLARFSRPVTGPGF